MPYKHANGCTCMTLPEFLNEEGKREGKTGGEVWAEITDDMEKDCRDSEARLKDNPDWLWEQFKGDAELVWEDSEGSDPIPVKIAKVVDAEVNDGFKKSSTVVLIDVECNDDKVHRCLYETMNWSGSFYEPPESDFILLWDVKGKTIKEAKSKKGRK